MAFNLAGSLITQTGTDANPSGLTGIAGVTETVAGSLRIINIGNLRLQINGNLTINGELYQVISTFTPASGTFPFVVNTGGTLTLGSKDVSNNGKKYSSGVPLIGAVGGNLNSLHSLDVLSGGTLNGLGGAIFSSGAMRFQDGSIINIESLEVVNISLSSRQLRVEHSQANSGLVNITERGLTLSSLNTNPFRLSTTAIVEFSPSSFLINFKSGQYQPAAGGYGAIVFNNFDNGSNISSSDFAYAGSGGVGGIQYNGIQVEFRNVAKRIRYTNANLAGGFSRTTKLANFSVVNVSNTPLSEVSYYAVDTDNGSRINFNGRNTLNDNVYSNQNQQSNISQLIDVEYMAGEGTTILVDDRADINNQISFSFIQYSVNPAVARVDLIGNGDAFVPVICSNDNLITEQNKAVSAAYTTQETPRKAYDQLKSILVDNYSGEAETLVSRDANTLDAKALNVTIDGSGSGPATLVGSTLTLNASTFVGNITTTGTVTLQNGATVTGGVIDSNGDSFVVFDQIQNWTIYPTLNDRDNNTNPIESGTTGTYRFNYTAPTIFYARVTKAGIVFLVEIAVNASGETVYSLSAEALLTTLPTLNDIEESTVLAKESTSQSVKATVEALSNYDDTILQNKVDAIETKAQADARQTALIAEHDATQLAITSLNDFDPATDQVIVATNNDKTGYGLANNAITSSVVANNAFNNSSFTTGYFNSINAEVDQALSDYDAPTKVELDNAESNIIAEINANEVKIDTIISDGAKTSELGVVNEGVKKASLLIPHNDDI